MGQPEPISRIVNFEEMAFGMFVHWGVYSVLQEGEWYVHLRGMPMSEYMKLKEQFTAEHFDPRQWARLARDAGMKYITLTTRHHDGFSLYDTRGLNDWDAPHSAAKRDLIEEFVEGCRAEGIVPFFYHTTLDWYQASFENDFPAYLQYLRDSVEILCTQYGEIGGFWFDGYWSKGDADWEEDRLYGMVRKHQPEAILINNPGWQRNGHLTHPELDSMTFEAALPEQPLDREGQPKYVACEAEAGISSWGYNKYAFGCKSPAEVIQALCHCRTREANYLLNVSPLADGAIPHLHRGVLETVGTWMAENGDAIYKGKPCDLVGSGENSALQGADRALYLLISDTNRPVAFSGATRQVETMHWLDSGESIPFCHDPTTGLLSFEVGKNPYGTVPRIARATPDRTSA